MIPQPRTAISGGGTAVIRGVLLAGVQALVIALVLFVALQGWHRDLRVPLRFSNDSVFFLMQTKGTVDTGWWWRNPWLSAPSTYDALAFPSNTNVDQLIVRLTSLVTHDAALCLNLAWLFMVVLSGLTATFCMRQLGISRLLSFVFGTLYALSPFPIYRNIDHFNLVVYLVPFPCAVSIMLASGRIPGTLRSPGVCLLLLGCGLLGFNYVYYAFFGVFFLAGALVVGAVAHRDRRVLKFGVVALIMVLFCTALNLTPSLYSWRHAGQPVVVLAKAPNQSEIYGLKIRHLVSPVFRYSAGPLHWWNEREAEAQFPLETENTISRLGLVGTLGFLCLLAVLFVPRTVARLGGCGMIIGAGRLNIAAILLATIGGFGSVFNLLVTPDIRGYNRICAFIAFFALLALALVFDGAIASCGGVARKVWIGAAILMLFVGIYDDAHVPIHLNVEYPEIARAYGAVRAVVGKMEASLPSGAMVYELPHVVFLNEFGNGRMQPYDHAKPYLTSHHLHWSYPALSNAQVRWEESLARLTEDELDVRLASEGFAAILIDRYGYDDNGDGVIQRLRAGLDPNAVIAEDPRYVVLDLRCLSSTGARSLKARSRRPAESAAGLGACDYAALANIDQIGSTRSPSTAKPAVVNSSNASVTGWAVDRGRKDVAAFVDVVVDGTAIPAHYGLDRADVATYFNTPGYRLSGFLAFLPPAQTGLGPHTLVLRIVSPDRTCVTETARFPFTGR